MGPRTLRSIFAVSCALTLAPAMRSQVFVVGMKTATSDVVTEFHPTHIEIPDKPLDEKGRSELLRNLEAEQGFAHRELPLGAGLTLIANGNMSPSGEAYKKLLYAKGQSVAAGERVAITALQFKPDTLVIDLNGGPYAKHRFLSHIQLNDIQLAPTAPTATGCRITLVFEGGLPEISAAEVKALLDPLVDFRARSSEEAYADTLPPKIKQAIDAHEILVGMDRRMVLASVGAPRDKHREHISAEDAESAVYEEWIYGEPPVATKFVRFQKGRVVRLEVAALGKPVEIFDKNELNNAAEPVLQTRNVLNGDVQPNAESGRAAVPPPTLRRPGDGEQDSPNAMGKVNLPSDTPKQKLRAATERPEANSTSECEVEKLLR